MTASAVPAPSRTQGRFLPFYSIENWLEPDLAARLTEALGLDERPLRITVQDERSLGRNQDIASARLTALTPWVEPSPKGLSRMIQPCTRMP